MKRLPKLIFDTSGINALAKDPDRKAIVEGLCIAYFVGITVTALSEIVATPDEDDRKELSPREPAPAVARLQFPGVGAIARRQFFLFYVRG